MRLRLVVFRDEDPARVDFWAGATTLDEPVDAELIMYGPMTFEEASQHLREFEVWITRSKSG